MFKCDCCGYVFDKAIMTIDADDREDYVCPCCRDESYREVDGKEVIKELLSDLEQILSKIGEAKNDVEKLLSASRLLVTECERAIEMYTKEEKGINREKDEA